MVMSTFTIEGVGCGFSGASAAFSEALAAKVVGTSSDKYGEILARAMLWLMFRT